MPAGLTRCCDAAARRSRAWLLLWRGARGRRLRPRRGGRRGEGLAAGDPRLRRRAGERPGARRRIRIRHGDAGARPRRGNRDELRRALRARDRRPQRSDARRPPLRLVLLRQRHRGLGRRGRLPAARRRGDLVGLPRLVARPVRAGRGRLLARAVRRRLRGQAAPGGGRMPGRGRGVRRRARSPRTGGRRGRLGLSGRRDPPPRRPLGAPARRPRRGAARARPADQRRLRQVRPRRRRLRIGGAGAGRRGGAALRPRRRPGRRDPPLRRAAGLARHRRDGRAACAPPRICSMPPTCETATRWRPKPGGRRRFRWGRDEVAVRLHAATGPAAGGFAGRRRRLPRRVRRGRLPLLEPAGARRRRRSARRSPAGSPAPAARCAWRCAWASPWRC